MTPLPRPGSAGPAWPPPLSPHVAKAPPDHRCSERRKVGATKLAENAAATRCGHRDKAWRKKALFFEHRTAKSTMTALEDEHAPNFQPNSCPRAVRLVAWPKCNKLQLRRGLNVSSLSAGQKGRGSVVTRHWHRLDAVPTELRDCAAPRAEKVHQQATTLGLDNRRAREVPSVSNDNSNTTDL